MLWGTSFSSLLAYVFMGTKFGTYKYGEFSLEDIRDFKVLYYVTTIANSIGFLAFHWFQLSSVGFFFSQSRNYGGCYKSLRWRNSILLNRGWYPELLWKLWYHNWSWLHEISWEWEVQRNSHYQLQGRYLCMLVLNFSCACFVYLSKIHVENVG